MEPIVTTGAIALGSVAWFANKLFGPSVEAMGEALRNYGTERVNRILGKAAEKIDPAHVQSLPPGFAVNFFQKASFSDDEDELTEMWANLLATAATNFTSRHAAYVEILSQLTKFDALTVQNLVPQDFAYFPALSMPVNMRVELRLKIANEMKNVSDTHEEAQAEFKRLMAHRFDWPGRITAARIHYREDGQKGTDKPLTGGIPDQFASFDNLERVGLIERFDVENSMKPYETAVEGVLVTALGVGFVQTCRGMVIR